MVFYMAFVGLRFLITLYFTGSFYLSSSVKFLRPIVASFFYHFDNLLNQTFIPNTASGAIGVPTIIGKLHRVVGFEPRGQPVNHTHPALTNTTGR